MKVLIVGAQDYCVDFLPKIISSIQPTHVFSDGSNKLKNYNLTEIKSLSDVKELDPDLILLARAPNLRNEIQRLVSEFSNLGFEVDHISHYRKIDPVFGTYLLKDLNRYTYIDYNNNKIILKKTTSDHIFIKYNAEAKNNTIKLGESLHVSKKFSIECYGDNANISIGNNSKFVDISIETGESSTISIGDDCMFSFGIMLSCTDQHPIFDLHTHKRLNKAKKIHIGNHIWIGRDVRVLGGANIGDGSVIGNRSITSSKFKKNVVLAGCPAKIVREDILWANDNLKFNEIDTFEECQDKSALKYL